MVFLVVSFFPQLQFLMLISNVVSLFWRLFSFILNLEGFQSKWILDFKNYPVMNARALYHGKL